MSGVVDYYNSYDEDSRFSRNSRKIEFLTSTHTLDKLIGAKCKILDVGAGPGAYSFYYAERGHDVVAVDLTPRHIETIIHKSQEQGMSNLQAYVADATNLSQFASQSFDVVMCFGPLYHLTTSEARESCIQECLRVLKDGGILAIAYINKYSIMPMLVTRNNNFIREDMIDKVIDNGSFKEDSEDCFWTESHFTSPDEIVDFISKFNTEEIDHVATDGLSHLIGEYVDQLSDDQFMAWYKYHLETLRVKSILGISTHGLYICRKIRSV
ncbi:class I SAM-dependent methyltransferase [Cohnella sp. WQ 127256]|uniref:class I SAM-dependent methyltransferase n=1 Tax=Cohnella sp. WQ 127256 TaxID=2938790 RepID=UPI00211832A1|nr:class I SAM-dependent methyltransferase [Cohnella sp. WQ 127256]